MRAKCILIASAFIEQHLRETLTIEKNNVVQLVRHIHKKKKNKTVLKAEKPTITTKDGIMVIM